MPYTVSSTNKQKLLITLRESEADIRNGKYKKDSIKNHIKRITNKTKNNASSPAHPDDTSQTPATS